MRRLIQAVAAIVLSTGCVEMRSREVATRSWTPGARLKVSPGTVLTTESKCVYRFPESDTYSRLVGTKASSQDFLKWWNVERERNAQFYPLPDCMYFDLTYWGRGHLCGSGFLRVKYRESQSDHLTGGALVRPLFDAEVCYPSDGHLIAFRERRMRIVDVADDGLTVEFLGEK